MVFQRIAAHNRTKKLFFPVYEGRGERRKVCERLCHGMLTSVLWYVGWCIIDYCV